MPKYINCPSTCEAQTSASEGGVVRFDAHAEETDQV